MSYSAPTLTEPTRPVKERIAWPDAARGFAIVLVVLHHAVQYAVSFDLSEPGWLIVTEALRTMRMPLFFLAAGLFAGKWVLSSWRSMLKNKVVLFLWVYALWVVIRWAWFNAVPGQDVESGVKALVKHLVLPLGGWFVVVLAAFFVIAKLTARVDRRIQLAVAAAVSLLWFSNLVATGNHAFDGIPMFYVFFVAGCYWRDGINDVSRSVSGVRGLPVVLVWLAAVGAASAFGLIDAPIVSFALRIAGVAAGLVFAVWLERILLLRYLGRNTLPIYLSSSLFILAAAWLISRSPLASVGGFGIWAPLLLLAIALPLSLGLGILAPRIHARWLFHTPRWLETGFDRVWPAGRQPRSRGTKRVLLAATTVVVVGALVAGTMTVTAYVAKVTPSSTPVAPIGPGALSTPSTTDATSAMFVGILHNVDRYAVTTWFPETFPGQALDDTLDFGGTGAGQIRPAASEALALATTLATGTFSEASVRASEAQTSAIAEALITSLADRHWSNTVWGGWGAVDSWQGAHWAEMTGMAAWLLWDRFSADEHRSIQNMIEKEADRFLEYDPPYWQTPDSVASGAAVEGDTKAEEVAWNSTVLQLAVAMLPSHPDAQRWQESATRMLLAAFAKPSDVTSSELIEGRPLSEWVSGWNIEENGLLYNHGILHPEYMATVTFKLQSSLTAALAGSAVNPAARQNVDLVYDALQTETFSSPPYEAPGGTIYVPGDEAIYYPEGADQGLDRRMNFATLDLMQSVFSADADIRAEAAAWAAIHGAKIVQMQSRFDDGRTYGPDDDDAYAARESWVARYAAWSVLSLAVSRG